MSFRSISTTALPSAFAVAALVLGPGCKSTESSSSPSAPATSATTSASVAPTSTSSAADGSGSASAPTSVHPLRVKRLDGSETALAAWAGKVVLVVNTASECGYTPQYEGLQAIYLKFEPRGFAVLGFPSNDFGGQEPGTKEEIATFCKVRYGVSFPLFEKVKTKGSGRAALYALLSDAKGEPKWNFHKYLVDKKGFPVRAWTSAVKPESAEIARAIEEQLASP